MELDLRSDLAAALAVSTAREMLNGKAARKKIALEANTQLGADERVLAAAYGTRRGLIQIHRHLLVVTNFRALVVRRNMIGGASESISLATVTGVSTARSLRFASVKFTGAGSNDTIPGLTHVDAERVAAVAREVVVRRDLNSGKGETSGPLVRRLSELETAREAGLISSEEYERARVAALDLRHD